MCFEGEVGVNIIVGYFLCKVFIGFLGVVVFGLCVFGAFVFRYFFLGIKRLCRLVELCYEIDWVYVFWVIVEGVNYVVVFYFLRGVDFDYVVVFVS